MIYLLFNKKTRQYADHHSQWHEVTESAAMKDTEFCLDLEELFENLYYLVELSKVLHKEKAIHKHIQIYLIPKITYMTLNHFYESLSIEDILNILPHMKFIPDVWLLIPEIELATKLL